MLFGVGVSCRILYSIVSYLYISCNGSITSVGEERANVSAIWILFGEVSSSSWCFILLWHSLCLPYNYFNVYRIIINTYTFES